MKEDRIIASIIYQEGVTKSKAHTKIYEFRDFLEYLGRLTYKFGPPFEVGTAQTREFEFDLGVGKILNVAFCRESAKVVTEDKLHPLMEKLKTSEVI